MDQQPRTATGQITLRRLLLAFGLLTVVMALLIPMVLRARKEAVRMSCSGRMKQLMLALHNYHDTFGDFPPAVTYSPDGKPMHSWRVLITPFLEQSAFFSTYNLNEPWNGPFNQQLSNGKPFPWPAKDGSTHLNIYEPRSFQCPGAPENEPQQTNYVMLVDDRPGRKNALPARPGSHSPDPSSPKSAILVEIRNSKIHWLEPEDISVSDLLVALESGSRSPLVSAHGLFTIGCADGSVRMVANKQELIESLD